MSGFKAFHRIPDEVFPFNGVTEFVTQCNVAKCLCKAELKAIKPLTISLLWKTVVL